MKTNLILIVGASLCVLPMSAMSRDHDRDKVEETTSTTESVGTINEFSPDTIVIRSESAPEPLRYSYSKTTTYVDDTGAPVAIDTVKSGLPVTVQYVREGDRLIARRVIVHHAPAAVVPGAPAIEKHTTTTTTTTEKK